MRPQRVADLLVRASRELTPEEYSRLLVYVVSVIPVAEVVAISQYIPAELRSLMPRHHLH